MEWNNPNITKVYWNVPTSLQSRLDLIKTKLYRSYTEQANYSLLSTIDTFDPSGFYVTQFVDDTPGNSKNGYYIVTLANSDQYESPYFLTYFDLSPREMRLINSTRVSIPPVIDEQMRQEDYQAALSLAVKWFNVIPPTTNFNVDNFPKGYENILSFFSQLTVILQKYLPIAIRDFDYSIPGGLGLRVDRGEKIKTMIDQLMTYMKEAVTVIKFEFAFTGDGLGTYLLPLSIGARIPQGLLNIFDILRVNF